MRNLSILNTKLWLFASSLLLASSMLYAADPAVKKSDAGICHEKGSPSYGNTKKFTAFASVDECVKNGGKLPTGQPTAAASAAAMVKKSDSGICHDAKSPSYERTKKFTEFKTVDECLKSGGKLPK